jgi:hypothetical protein
VTDLKVMSVPAVAVLALLPTTALVIAVAIAVLVALTFVPFGWERVRLDNERRRRELPPLRPPASSEHARDRAPRGAAATSWLPRAAVSHASGEGLGETSADVSVRRAPH